MDRSDADEPLDIGKVAMDLHDAAVEAAPSWVAQVVAAASHAFGLDIGDDDIGRVQAEVTAMVARRFEELATTDIDQQRTTPLSIFRASADEISAFLLANGAPRSNAAAVDPFGIHPHHLADVGPAVHEAGMLWGATKAAVHLQRRRDQ